MLEAGGAERLTVLPGPVEALSLEPGDTVTVEGRGGGWRVMRLDMDETPSALLERIPAVVVGEDDGRPAAGAVPGAAGAPFFRMIELPPLAGNEEDARPVAVVAADPWRPMRVFAGPDAGSLTARGDVAQPATVGVLVEALAAGPRHRRDEANTMLVRVEGRAPQSRSDAAVHAGGNAVAVEGTGGWELVQFRTATLVGGDVWRLSGLLRGQQGTVAAGAAGGAEVVFLDQVPARVESPRAERGLPLIWRAGPAGGPAGGAGAREIGFRTQGVHDRPWSPAHLRAEARADGGFDLAWIVRSRIDGDRWDGEAVASGSLRFRVRVLDGDETVRVFEVEDSLATYTAASLAEDFPGGLAAGSRVAVAEWGDGYGWGIEAFVGLPS